MMEVYGFYEDEFPIYTNADEAHLELSSPITVDEANALVRRIKDLTAERDKLRDGALEVAAYRAQVTHGDFDHMSLVRAMERLEAALRQDGGRRRMTNEIYRTPLSRAIA